MFDTMDAPTLLVISILVLGISFLITHSIIKSATQSDRVVKHLDQQNKLLMGMLKKSGVSNEEIQQMISPAITEEKTPKT